MMKRDSDEEGNSPPRMASKMKAPESIRGLPKDDGAGENHWALGGRLVPSQVLY